MRRLLITAAARRDIQDIYWASEERHGSAAARRYRALVDLALSDIQREPDLPTSKATGVADIRVYALRIPARRLAPEAAVRSPPHLVAYRFGEATVEVVRVLHGSMDVRRRLVEEADE